MKVSEKKAKENNRDYALRILKENIINLELKPGSMISEQDIANELNLSRTPVHEALQELSTTKIIQILPQRGSYVSLIDLSLVDEAIFMRSTIEVAVAELACDKASEQDLISMEENLNLQKFFLEKFLHVLWCSFVYTLIIMCTARPTGASPWPCRHCRSGSP